MTERYLEDFKAGQISRSERIRIDADRFKGLCSRFISTKEPPPTRYFEVSPPAVGTPPRSR